MVILPFSSKCHFPLGLQNTRICKVRQFKDDELKVFLKKVSQRNTYEIYKTFSSALLYDSKFSATNQKIRAYQCNQKFLQN